MENSGFTSLDGEALPLPTDQAKIKQWTTWLSGLYQAKKSQSITQLWWQHFSQTNLHPLSDPCNFFYAFSPESFLLAAASVLADRVVRTNTIYPDMMLPNSYLKKFNQGWLVFIFSPADIWIFPTLLLLTFQCFFFHHWEVFGTDLPISSEWQQQQ